MTGPEHYREAERLLEEAHESEIFQYKRLHEAQIHATLALAAATALSGADGSETWDYSDWLTVTGAGAGSKPAYQEPTLHQEDK